MTRTSGCESALAALAFFDKHALDFQQMMATVDFTNQTQAARPDTGSGGRSTLLAAGMFAAVAIAAHAWVAHDDAAFAVSVRVALQAPPSTLVFAGVGGLFLLLTWLAHLPVARALSRQGSERQESDAQAVAVHQTALWALLLPMAIRLAGTFLLLSGLIGSALVRQNEAVFNVLFWYVTLTSIEVVGIVWASKPAASSASATFDSATKGV